MCLDVQFVIVFIIGISLLVFVYFIVLIIKGTNKNIIDDGNKFAVFFVENDQLIINSLAKKSYSLSDIASVKLSCLKGKNSHYQGWMKITLNNNKNRWFMFDGSVATKKTMLVSSESEIRESIIFLEKELHRNGIEVIV